jgi:threonine synthase
VSYHLDQVGHHFKKTDLLDRPADMWRYLEIMPVEGDEDIISLGEGFTPLLRLQRLGKPFGCNEIYIKEEATNPTGSFKARGLSAAVTLANKLGARKLCIPTAGNAGGALAAYGARAGLECHVFMPSDTPIANQIEVRVAGANIYLVDGLITDAGRMMAERKDEEGWFDVSTLKEPYRIEGKKTMGYELAEQFHWKLPSVILYPTGGGTGLIGMWKAFEEMEELGWIDGERPRMVAVQSEGCAPIVKAFEENLEVAPPWPNAATFASGIRVPKAIGDFLILDAVRASQGCAVAVSERSIHAALAEVGAQEGIFMCPEGAACWAAFRVLAERQWIKPHDRVVVFNTGAGHKYIDSLAFD